MFKKKSETVGQKSYFWFLEFVIFSKVFQKTDVCVKFVLFKKIT